MYLANLRYGRALVDTHFLKIVRISVTCHKSFFSICFWCSALITGENKNEQSHNLVGTF